nr:hypothetical protein [Clostridiales bacterium]
MLKILLKVRFQYLIRKMFYSERLKNSKRKTNSSTGGKVALGILLAFVFAWVMFFFGMVAFNLGNTVVGTDGEWIIFGLFGVGALLLCVFGSVFATYSQLFDAKDNELLLSMPIKPKDILLSRMLFLLLINLIYVLVIMLPTIVVYNILTGFNILKLLLEILSVFGICLISMSISSLLAWIIGAVSSKTNKKLKSIITLLFSAAFFTAYMAVCFNMDKYMKKLVGSIETISVALKGYFVPAYWLGNGICNLDIVHYLCFLALCIIPFVLVCVILSKTFISIVTSNKGSGSAKYKEKKIKALPIKKTLLHKEFSTFFNTSSYMLNCGLGVIIDLIFAVIIVLKGPALLNVFLSAGTTEVPQEFLDSALKILPEIFCYILCFMASMTSTTYSSISLEGQNIYTLKAMPIKTKDIINAKLSMNIVLGVPGMLIAGVCCCFAFDLTTLQKVMIILAPVFAQISIALFGMLINLTFPMLEWDNPTLVVKNSKSAM